MKLSLMYIKQEIKMSNKPLLTNKLPYADRFTDPEEAINYMVKTLNSSFLPDSSTFSLSDLGNSFTVSYSLAAGNFITTFTVKHGLSKVPSGFIIVSNTLSNLAAGDYVNFTLDSATSDQIVLKYFGKVTNANTGKFTALVLE